MIGAEFHNSPGHLQLLFYELDKFDGMRLKIDSLHCRSFSQNMSREIHSQSAPHVIQFTSGKNFRSSYLAN